MTEITEFKGFFSYARHDFETDSELVTAFTTVLTGYVNAKLVNAKFSIFRDTERLKTGALSDVSLESELRSTDVLVVLLTPSWIESDYCRKEFLIFEEVESDRPAGEYVIPILGRRIEEQERHLTRDQKRVYQRLKARQFLNAGAVDFGQMSDGTRKLLIDKLADDIVGMIERLRMLAESPPARNIGLRRSTAHEYTLAAHNFSKVDFISGAEILVEFGKRRINSDVYAQFDFIERLYVEAKSGRIEFGVRRALLSLNCKGNAQLLEVDDFKSRAQGRNTYYLTRRDAQGAITICMDPPNNRSTLAELALPPASGGNYLSHVATAMGAVHPKQIVAELRVSLCSEGLQIFDSTRKPPSQAVAKKIEAIMRTAVTKNRWTVDKGEVRRRLSVRESQR